MSMDDHGRRYAVTVYVAAAGTPLMAGGTSFGGHMYYSIDDGATVKSYGFSPIKHGEASGPGKFLSMTSIPIKSRITHARWRSIRRSMTSWKPSA